MKREPGLDRRQTIRSLAGGGLLLLGLLSEMLAATPEDPLRPKEPHYAAKAKRVIFLFMPGGVSHVDTFDPKPFLRKNHDQPFSKNRVYKGSDWEFRPYGQRGIQVSDLFPEIGGVVDDIAVVRSMKNINGDHFGKSLGIHIGSDAPATAPASGRGSATGSAPTTRICRPSWPLRPSCRTPAGRCGVRTFCRFCTRAPVSCPARSRLRT